jgi:hypothetical protein
MAVALLGRLGASPDGGGLLIGVNLIKDPVRLHAAYNDAAGGHYSELDMPMVIRKFHNLVSPLQGKIVRILIALMCILDARIQRAHQVPSVVEIVLRIYAYGSGSVISN